MDVAFSVNSEILVFSKYYRFNLFATIGMSILIVVLNYWLIPIYGIDGAAMASALVMLLYNLTKFIFLKIRLGFSPFSPETLKILAVGFFALLPGRYNFFDLEPIPQMIATSVLVLAAFMFFSMLLNVGQEEWKWIKEKIKKSGS
jgi:O-antigen/teichoic acid export membrane protein